MPTKLKRYTVTLPPDLETMVEKDSELNRRPVANQMVWILTQYYEERKREADLFSPSQLREARQADSRSTPVFRTADPLPAESSSKSRESMGRGKS